MFCAQGIKDCKLISVHAKKTYRVRNVMAHPFLA